jgi:light-harvesting complex II chlorophyll a/b binding protein 4
MASSVAAAASTFLGTRLADPAPQNGRIVARFGFGKAKKPAAPKKVSKTSTDGSLVGDYGFDPFGLGKPVEYLQFELDSLDQNLAKNEPGAVIGTRFESSDVKSTPLQPYSEVFGLQRFRECELIHGRWAMLATLGALSVEWLTGVTWQDAGKVR